MKFGGISGCQGTISSALSFLSRTQNSDGSFRVTGYAQASENSNSFTVRYTSFVLLAFLENRESGYTNLINNALKYIETYSTSCDNYCAAITALALAMGSKTTASSQLLEILDQNKVLSGNHAYWNQINHQSSQNDIKILITSYVALAYMKLNNPNKAGPAIGYLISVRNPNGHFYSAHDTAMAMEAIAEFAKFKYTGTMFKTDQYDLSISFTNQKKEKEEMRVNKTNWDKVQYIEMPKYSRNVEVKIEGIGYASMALIYEFYKTVDVNSKTFSLDLEYNRGDAKKAEVKACATNTGDKDISEQSILSFTLTGGYVYDTSNSIDRTIFGVIFGFKFRVSRPYFVEFLI